MRPEHERPDPPRCASCGRFKQVLSNGDRCVVYECCDGLTTKFRPQFEQPSERVRDRRT